MEVPAHSAFNLSTSLVPPHSTQELDLWLVAYRASPNPVEASVYCISIDTASDHHPSDVDTWYCKFREGGKIIEGIFCWSVRLHGRLCEHASRLASTISHWY